MADGISKPSELVLADGTYAYMQDVTKGTIRTYTGPTVINQTAQDAPVKYDPSTGTFSRVPTLELAVCKSPIAVEGYYLVLLNPPKPGEHPLEKGSAGKQSPELDVGRRVNIPGPVMLYGLWPGQAATMVRGHQLSRNEYLKVRVYNEVEARKNWGQAVVQLAAPTEGEVAAPVSVQTSQPPQDLSVGKMLIIEGQKVSFYIPPTGVTVVMDEVSGKYVREALTLERLEYCVLVDEDGNKRYERGPKVEFPQPTETFIKDGSKRKFRAMELNDIQGLHIKVIADYDDSPDEENSPGPNLVRAKSGDELFITGRDTAIYYPRQEHSLVRYDGRAKHYATAIPAGEARYVMHRMDGTIKMVKGPAMLLPNPIFEVIVRRVLTPKQCVLWYPANNEVIEFNNELRAAMANAPTTRAGAVSDGDLERSVRSRRSSKDGGTIAAATRTSGMDSAILGEAAGQGMMADEFSRQSTYTQPRTVTLDKTNYGVPLIQPYTSHAVMVTKKTGERRVVVGPATVLLDYDESLEVLELSTGKPKTTDNLLKTVYLRHRNNKVADIVEVETADHVRVQFKLSYVVSFEGAPEKWFSIENYIKYMCDHLRSVLKGYAKLVKIAGLDENPTAFIRDMILGAPADDDDEEAVREGHFFSENGCRVTDVEVLKVAIMDERIASLLHQQQHHVVSRNIELERERHNLDVGRQLAIVAREHMDEQLRTIQHEAEVAQTVVGLETRTALAKSEAALAIETKRADQLHGEQANIDLTFGAKLARDLKSHNQEEAFALATQERVLAHLLAETQSVVKRAEAFGTGFSEALLTLSDRNTLVQVAEAMSVQRLVGGGDFVTAVSGLFEKTPALKGMFEKISSGAEPGRNGRTLPSGDAPAA